jgi:hypothetical protein
MPDYFETEHVHQHKYFAYTHKSEFEPVDINKVVFRDDYLEPPVQLYRRVEYLISGCSCGLAVKSKVKDITE